MDQNSSLFFFMLLHPCHLADSQSVDSCSLFVFVIISGDRLGMSLMQFCLLTNVAQSYVFQTFW